MIWLKKAKSILAAFAAGGADEVEDSLESWTEYESAAGRFCGYEIGEHLIRQYGECEVSYEVARSAYNDKIIFLETTQKVKKGKSTTMTPEVHIFEFDNYGKVKFWRVY